MSRSDPVEVDLTEAVEKDLQQWEYALAAEDNGLLEAPDPHEENGLPSGWVIWSRYAECSPGDDWVLARRPEGDWVVVRHRREQGITIPVADAPTLLGLYGGFGSDRSSPGITNRHVPWLRKVVLRLYDPTDPVEAREQVLVALGCDVTHIPRIAT